MEWYKTRLGECLNCIKLHSFMCYIIIIIVANSNLTCIPSESSDLQSLSFGSSQHTFLAMTNDDLLTKKRNCKLRKFYCTEVT